MALETMEHVKCIILGGGQGKRLYPLTRDRSKPAVPIGGKYRLIDITLSNSINSKIKDIFILTQFNSKSLNNHISRTYKFDYFSDMSVQLLAAEQTMANRDWFEGTADAVRKHWVHYRLEPTDDVVILSGDHLYEMDYSGIVRFHRSAKADVTVSTTLVPQSQVAELGVVKINPTGRIVDFAEKPSDPATLKSLATNLTVLRKAGAAYCKTVGAYCLPVPALPAGRRQAGNVLPLGKGESTYLGSMGVYVFRAHVLEKLLKGKEADFGKEIIPKAIFSTRSYAYLFQGYWRDIGTIRSFYEANISLAKGDIPFSFYSPRGKFYTHPRFLPPMQVRSSRIEHSLLCEGSILDGASICESVVGLRSLIGQGTCLEASYMMGADFYEKPELRPKGVPPVGVGKGCVIRRAILDKNVRIGDHVKIVNTHRRREFDGPSYSIRDGIVIIPRGAVVKSGTVI